MADNDAISVKEHFDALGVLERQCAVDLRDAELRFNEAISASEKRFNDAMREEGRRALDAALLAERTRRDEAAEGVQKLVNAISEKIEGLGRDIRDLATSRDTTAGHTGAGTATWGYVIAAVMALIAVAAVVVSLVT